MRHGQYVCQFNYIHLRCKCGENDVIAYACNNPKHGKKPNKDKKPIWFEDRGK